MDGFLALVTAFPTVIFAVLAALCLAYWCLVLVGVADVDVAGADPDVDALAGAVKGLGAAAKGAAIDPGGGVVNEALAALGLARVPFTIPLTVLGLVGFLCSATTTHVLGPLLPRFIVALIAAVVGSVGGAGAAVLLARSVARIFVDGAVEQGGDSLVGRTCRITIAADGSGGQARVDEVIIAVRAPGQPVEAGAEAVIVERADDGIFIVEPLAVHLAETAAAFARLEAQAGTAVDRASTDRAAADRAAADRAAADRAAADRAAADRAVSTEPASRKESTS